MPDSDLANMTWTQKLYYVLDDLVARNFEILYHSRSTVLDIKIWSDISHQVYEVNDLHNLSETDPDYKEKKRRRDFTEGVLSEYIEDFFPGEWNNERFLHFVQQYHVLPRYLPEVWATFEREEIDMQVAERRRKDQLIRDYLAV